MNPTDLIELGQARITIHRKGLSSAQTAAILVKLKTISFIHKSDDFYDVIISLPNQKPIAAPPDGFNTQQISVIMPSSQKTTREQFTQTESMRHEALHTSQLTSLTKKRDLNYLTSRNPHDYVRNWLKEVDLDPNSDHVISILGSHSTPHCDDSSPSVIIQDMSSQSSQIEERIESPPPSLSHPVYPDIQLQVSPSLDYSLISSAHQAIFSPLSSASNLVPDPQESQTPDFLHSAIHLLDGVQEAEISKKEHAIRLKTLEIEENERLNRIKQKREQDFLLAELKRAQRSESTSKSFMPLIPIPKPLAPGIVISPYPLTAISRDLVFNSKAFVNLTPLHVPEQIKMLLSYGIKFSIPVKYEVGDFEILSEALHQLNEIYLLPFEAKMLNRLATDLISNADNILFNRSPLEVSFQSYIQKAFKDTIRFFKKTPGIMAAQADKANATILMYTQDYLDKCYTILEDTKNYTHIEEKNSSLQGYKNKNIKLLSRMEALNLITPGKKMQVINDESRMSNFYAFIKTHKEGQPARPVVNTRSSPGYHIGSLFQIASLYGQKPIQY